MLEPFRGLSRVFELAEVLRFLLAGRRVERNFFRLDLGLCNWAAAEYFSYLVSSSGLFKML
jgi:hypothetical protein